MKNNITLATLLLSTIITFAQHNVLQDIHDSFLFQEKENPKFEEGLKEAKFPTLRNNNGTIWVQDSSYSYSFNDGNEYLDSRKRVYARDEFGHAIVEMSHFWDDNTQNWIKGDTITTSYYGGNQRNKYFSRPWNTELQEWADTSDYWKNTIDGAWLFMYGGFWDNSNNEFIFRIKYCFTLDESGKYLYDIDSKWDYIEKEWKLTEKWFYTYGTNGNISYNLIQNWDNETATWVDAKQHFRTYDDEENVIQYLDKDWDNETSSWINSHLTLIDYNESGDRTRNLYQTWNNEINTWINSFQFVYSYDDNDNLISELHQNWDTETNTWINSSQYLSTYNTNGYKTLMLGQIWNNEANVWEKYSQGLSTYDSDGNRIQWLYQRWYNETWKDSNKTTYFWSEYEVEKVNSQENHTFIYPNPANNVIRIEGINKAKISIYSMNGKLIKQTKLQNNEVDISDLQEGAYLIKIISQDEVFMKQIIKE